MKKRKKYMRKLVFPLLLIIFLPVFLQMIKFAASYYSDRTEQKNIFLVGHVETDITEDYEPPEDILPGDEIRKEVKLKNTGTQSCYVRCLIVAGDDSAGIIFENDSEEAWERKADGYYYYRYVLEPGESTRPALSRFLITKETEEEAELSIIVYSESVRAEGFASAEEAFKDFITKEGI